MDALLPVELALGDDDQTRIHSLRYNIKAPFASNEGKLRAGKIKATGIDTVQVELEPLKENGETTCYEGAPLPVKSVDVMLIWDSAAESYVLHRLTSVTRLKKVKSLPPITLSDPNAISKKRPAPVAQASTPTTSSPPVSAKRPKTGLSSRTASVGGSRGRGSTPLAEADETDDFDFASRQTPPANAPTSTMSKSARLPTSPTFAHTPTMPQSPALAGVALSRSSSSGKGLALVGVPPSPQVHITRDDEALDSEEGSDYEELEAMATTMSQSRSTPAQSVASGPFHSPNRVPTPIGYAQSRQQRSPGLSDDSESDESDEE